jgi:hypothetical protein
MKYDSLQIVCVSSLIAAWFLPTPSSVKAASGTLQDGTTVEEMDGEPRALLTRCAPSSRELLLCTLAVRPARIGPRP